MLHIQEGETIIYFYDQTGGSGSQGICVTDMAIYWRYTAFTRAQRISLTDICSIELYLRDNGFNYLWFRTIGDKRIDTNVQADIPILNFLREIVSILRTAG